VFPWARINLKCFPEPEELNYRLKFPGGSGSVFIKSNPAFDGHSFVADVKISILGGLKTLVDLEAESFWKKNEDGTGSLSRVLIKERDKNKTNEYVFGSNGEVQYLRIHNGEKKTTSFVVPSDLENSQVFDPISVLGVFRCLNNIGERPAVTISTGKDFYSFRIRQDRIDGDVWTYSLEQVYGKKEVQKYLPLLNVKNGWLLDAEFSISLGKVSVQRV
jgi:hypothetical protein